MIHISENMISLIKKEAEKSYPYECCGFILGTIENKDKYTEQIVTSNNSSDESEKYHRFIITPEAMIKAERLARSYHMDIIGFYHSHPDCAAVPSRYDTDNALPVYSYIIVSVRKGKAGDLSSWELDSAADYREFKFEKIDRGE